ncbi:MULTISPECIES: di-heme oxidoreductase family protein [Deefgea]|uniref:C-type cytochrome n=1 Tax=Deefgea chitinilytica TaxID=570276 RepID=A0ABS2CE57_9NEIS|nr:MULTISPECIES: di-heme oxidoredictase family protein [Deefgea]MBM5572432.1 c-type cytochrome [Deefgea chitinilytica]MBM9889668.1 c-type cytochrome [Deefgea sp. CFH1-16]
MQRKLSLIACLLAGSVLAYEGQAMLALFEPSEEFPAGEVGTIDDHGKNAFSLPYPGLTDEQKTDFVVGNSFFKKPWVEAPSSTTARDGLGPHFVANSCGACHALDGRGAPPDFKNGIQQEQPMALLLRLSIPGQPEPKPDPVYGGQLNNQAVRGVKPEGKVAIRYEEIHGQFADGTPYSLQKPHYQISQLAYGPLHKEIMISPRIAPQMIGLGLLEAIPEAAILQNATRQRQEGKGIAGQPNYVMDAFAGKELIGRFGWKANVGSVAQQTAGAFLGDIGITSSKNPHEECMPKQKDCLRAPNGGQPEIDDDKLAQVIFYSQTLAVPTRRDADSSDVLRGKQIFSDANCASCHTPSYKTAEFTAIPQLANQTIYPYTDLLLHDMGDGLADGRPDGRANGKQWKTPPLWGLGLVKTVNGHTRYLHDGRARNMLEAVLWHGGEAEASKQAVLKLSAADRDKLLKFLNSL